MNKLCVYCGSSVAVPEQFYDAARALGTEIANQGWGLVYGGVATGLMGAVADATLAAGGHVTGVIPANIAEKKVQHPGLSELIVTPNLHARKTKMFELSDAFVAAPGGLGTLEEAFEILTWRQLGLHAKPLIFLNTDNIWTPIKVAMDTLINNGFAKQAHHGMQAFVETPEQVFPTIESMDRTLYDPTIKWLAQ